MPRAKIFLELAGPTRLFSAIRPLAVSSIVVTPTNTIDGGRLSRAYTIFAHFNRERSERLHHGIARASQWTTTLAPPSVLLWAREGVGPTRARLMSHWQDL